MAVIAEIIQALAEKGHTIAENERGVYNAGHNAGREEGYREGYDEGFTNGEMTGKEDEHFVIWSAIQLNGTRTNYDNGVLNWNLEGVRPFYDIRPTSCAYMFRGARGEPTDLAQVFDECGIVFDTSASTGFSWMFFTSNVTHLSVIDTTSAKVLDCTFYGTTHLRKIDKLILKSDGSQTFTTPFYGASALEELTIEGTIGTAGFNTGYSTLLTKESITSVINALSTSTSGLTVTFSKTAVNKAFETSEGANDGSASSEWAALIATKSNWNIALA